MPRVPDSSPQTLAVFRALLTDLTRWRHGYDLSQQTSLSSGTLYPILMRLTDRELLEARWEAPTDTGRPPRHSYRLTASGAELARERLAAVSSAAQTSDRPVSARPAPRRSAPGRTAPGQARIASGVLA